MSESKDQDQAQLTPKPGGVGRRSFLKGLGVGAATGFAASVFGTDNSRKAVDTAPATSPESRVEDAAAINVLRKALNATREFINPDFFTVNPTDPATLSSKELHNIFDLVVTRGNNEVLYKAAIGPNQKLRVGVFLETPKGLKEDITKYSIAFPSIGEALPEQSETLKDPNVTQDEARSVAEYLFRIPQDAQFIWVPEREQEQGGSGKPLALRAVGARQGRIFEVYINTLGAAEMTITEPTNIPEHIDPN